MVANNKFADYQLKKGVLIWQLCLIAAMVVYCAASPRGPLLILTPWGSPLPALPPFPNMDPRIIVCLPNDLKQANSSSASQSRGAWFVYPMLEQKNPGFCSRCVLQEYLFCQQISSKINSVKTNITFKNRACAHVRVCTHMHMHTLLPLPPLLTSLRFLLPKFIMDLVTMISELHFSSDASNPALGAGTLLLYLDSDVSSYGWARGLLPSMTSPSFLVLSLR